jgi:type II secretory pathway component PulM
MQDLKNYFSQLSKRDRVLLVGALTLLSFLIIKVFIINGLESQNKKLTARANVVQQQEKLLASVNAGVGGQQSLQMASSQVISDFLKQNNTSDLLKQIRTTSKGEQRFEIEDIRFDQLVELLAKLESNGTNFTSLQIKNRNTSGVVNAVLTVPN